MVKVLIVDDQKTVQELLKSYFDRESDIEIIGVANNGKIALEKIEALKPDVVLMDIDMPILDGLSATKIITDRFVETKVLILSVHDEDVYLNKALQVGAKGYLLKNTPPEELIQAIHSACKNYFQLGPGLLEKYLHKLVTSQLNFNEVDRIKTLLEKQSQLLEKIQEREIKLQKQEKSKNPLEREYFLLKREIYSLQYGQEKLKKQIDLAQNIGFLSILVLAAIASVFVLRVL